MELFNIFVQVQTLEQALLYFLIFGKTKVPPNKFYTINYKCGGYCIHWMRPKSEMGHLFRTWRGKKAAEDRLK